MEICSDFLKQLNVIESLLKKLKIELPYDPAISLLSTHPVVQSHSRVWLFATPGTAARQALLSLTIPRSLPKFMSTCVGDNTQTAYLLTPSSSAFNLSQHQGLCQWVICSHQITKILELQQLAWPQIASIAKHKLADNFRNFEEGKLNPLIVSHRWN